MTILTKRFILRPFRRGDEAALARYINNRNIYRNTLRIPYPYRMRDAHAWVRQNAAAARARAKTEINFAIEIGGEAAGGIGLHKIEPRHKAELGYWLAEPYWGRGIMTEAVRQVVRFGFSQMRLVRICAKVFPWNRPSMRVLEKAGFKHEGILRKGARKGKRFIDEHVYAIVR